MTEQGFARLAGWLYLATFVTSIPALALKTPAMDAALTGSIAPGATHARLAVGDQARVVGNALLQ